MRRDKSERRGVEPLSVVLAGYLRDTQLDSRMRESQVLSAWKTAVGPNLAERARPVRFSAGELVVEVSSAALLGELVNFTGETHRRAANKQLGTERIRTVSYKPRR